MTFVCIVLLFVDYLLNFNPFIMNIVHLKNEWIKNCVKSFVFIEHSHYMYLRPSLLRIFTVLLLIREVKSLQVTDYSANIKEIKRTLGSITNPIIWLNLESYVHPWRWKHYKGSTSFLNITDSGDNGSEEMIGGKRKQVNRMIPLKT